jgi:hypothetical protein
MKRLREFNQEEQPNKKLNSTGNNEGIGRKDVDVMELKQLNANIFAPAPPKFEKATTDDTTEQSVKEAHEQGKVTTEDDVHSIVFYESNQEEQPNKNLNSTGNNEDIGRKDVMESKQFTTNIFLEDLEAFEAAIKSGTTEQWIKSFMEEHNQDNVTTENDVYSLVLNTAISLRHIDTIKYILNKEHTGNILTSVSESRFSPISGAFYTKNEDILKLISLYMKKSQNTFEKTDLIGKDKGNIITVITYPSIFGIDKDPAECLRDFIYPLYTKKSLEELTGLIGVDNIDDIFIEN